MFTKAIAHFLNDEDGATLVEYGVALTVVVIISTAALVTLAGTTNTNIGNATTAATLPP